MKSLRHFALITLAALTLSACTFIGPNAQPQLLNKSDVSFDLLHRYIPQTNHARVRFVTQPMYLLDAGNHLAPASRIVPSPIQLETVLRQLLLGPSAIEYSAGYSSALPRTFVLVSAKIEHGIGVINLGNHLDKLGLTKEIRAEGQLVLTAALAGARRGVIIDVADVRQVLPLPNGKRVSFLTSSEFQSLLNS